jgi:hypothetical protein
MKEVNVLADIDLDSELDFKVREKDEILKGEEMLTDMVWYTRHMFVRNQIDEGLIKIVEVEDYQVSSHKETIRRDVWERALHAAKEVEQLYGVAFLGPWSDLEWGMINGKLSALRWVLGDDWDQLDT